MPVAGESPRPSVHISVDMEGIAGIATRNQVIKGQSEYAAGQVLMTAEADAAVRGAFEGGAQRVVVSDAHGDMSNLLLDKIDPRAEVLSGGPKVPWGMMQGVDWGHDVALFVGYHARAGTAGAVLAHSYSGASIAELRVNGEPWGEGDMNAAVAGSFAVPIGLVSGDDVTCAELSVRLPDATAVVTKTALGTSAASHVHPERIREQLRSSAAEAVRTADKLSPFVPDGPFVVEVDLKSSTQAEICAMVPGARQTGPRTVQADAADIAGVRRYIFTWTGIAGPA